MEMPSFNASTYRTKLKLDKEVGGGDLSDLCTIAYHYIPNCIPLCLNPKFRTLYRGAADNTPTSNAELLKLKLGLIGISDIEWVNGKFPLLDS